jgi:hypothetical protein
MKLSTYKKQHTNRGNLTTFKTTKGITADEVKQALSKTKTLTDEESVMVKEWLNTFMKLTYKTWKQQQVEITSINNDSTNNKIITNNIIINKTKNIEQHEEGNYLYPSEYRRTG